MQRNNIPTARFCNFQDLNAALEHLESIDYEVVIKVLSSFALSLTKPI
jgi:phosphoribosylamine-glycine ligase